MAPRSASTRASRRRFLELMAAGSAAVLAGATPVAAAPAPAPARKRAAARPTALETEIQNQKRSLAQALATIRDFTLEPGSEPAATFAPLEAPPGKKRAR
jgi:hypothetical protein